jgi:hypothetical protein
MNNGGQNGDVVIRANTISDGDTGGSEGMARSRVFIKQRYRRNAGGFTYNENTAVFLATTASDSNGRRVTFQTRGGMSANQSSLLSDDRIKFDEEDISGATETIMKLKPQKYQKYDEIKPDLSRPEGTGKLEIGLIAQDVEVIPELSHVVETSISLAETEEERTNEILPKTVCYTQIMCLHLQAFKEQQQLIESLKGRIEALEAGD